jgi:tetratricopeptide (TPR) repeat protein
MEDTLADTTRATDERAPAREPGIPARIGRYTVLKAAGAGGMGVVYVAYDTELDRKLAIKLLHPDPFGEADGPRQGRLLREAQAMAKISHPNVLQVFESGTHAGRVFLALEFIDGQTLEGWLAARPRRWREVVEVFLQAGRGLQAAHAAGLVHRDFKPANVLVDRSDRARVMDFGLARAAGPAPSTAPAEPLGGNTPSLLHDPLTRTGAVMGTPLYMAPEQHLVGDVDGRTDEFAFCVALYEALWGQRPFPGDGLHALALSVVQGRVREPPRGRGVPNWLRRVVLRGLQVDPAARYPDMGALLADLGRDRAAQRRRWLLGLGVAASLGAGAWGLAAGRADAPRCDGAAGLLAGVWDPERAVAVRAAFAASGRPYAEPTWSKVQVVLDDHARGWAALRTAACEAHARGEASDELLDAGMACLARRRSELKAVVDRLAEANGEVVDRAVAAVRGLSPLAVCGDAGALLARVKPPDDPALRDEVERLRAQLDQAQAAQLAGKYPSGVTIAADVAVAADAVGYRPLIAEARLQLGELHGRASDFPAADRELWASLWAAEAGRHDAAAAAAWTELVRSATKQGRFADARRWAERAGAAVARLGDDPRAEARLINELGSLEYYDGHHAAAVEQYQRALELRRAALGPDHPDVAATLGNLGNALFGAKRSDEAIAALEQALALREALLGPDHPDVATALNNLGVVDKNLGRVDKALAAYRRAREIWTRALGPDHPAILPVLLNLGALEHTRGEFLVAIALFEEALAAARVLPEDSPLRSSAAYNLTAVYLHRGDTDRAEALLRSELARLERIYGADDLHVAEVIALLGSVDALRERWDAARAWVTRAVELFERRLGPRHSQVGQQLAALALIEVELGRLADAEAHARRALEIGEATSAADDPQRGPVRAALGRVLLARGRAAEALRLLERAAVDAARQPLELDAAAHLDFARARALVATGGDLQVARTLALRARPHFVSLAATAPRQLAWLDAWLARHR